MKAKLRSGTIAVLLILMLAACTAMQDKNIEVTGKLGSPDATTTISGKQLPPPAPNSAA